MSLRIGDAILATISMKLSRITEENFWRNYFYRVSLICQANEADAAGGRQSSAEDSQGKILPYA